MEDKNKSGIPNYLIDNYKKIVNPENVNPFTFQKVVELGGCRMASGGDTEMRAFIDSSNYLLIMIAVKNFIKNK